MNMSQIRPVPEYQASPVSELDPVSGRIAAFQVERLLNCTQLTAIQNLLRYRLNDETVVPNTALAETIRSPLFSNTIQVRQDCRHTETGGNTGFARPPSGPANCS